MDTRFIQAHKEARWAIWLTLAYAVCWAASAYCLGAAPGILGLPRWFEVSCLFVPILFIVLCAAMIKHVYKHVPLGSSSHED